MSFEEWVDGGKRHWGRVQSSANQVEGESIVVTKEKMTRLIWQEM